MSPQHTQGGARTAPVASPRPGVPWVCLTSPSLCPPPCFLSRNAQNVRSLCVHCPIPAATEGVGDSTPCCEGSESRWSTHAVYIKPYSNHSVGFGPRSVVILHSIFGVERSQQELL